MSDLLHKGLELQALLPLGLVLLLLVRPDQVEGDQMVVDLVEVLVEEALDKEMTTM